MSTARIAKCAAVTSFVLAATAALASIWLSDGWWGGTAVVLAIVAFVALATADITSDR